MKTPARAALIAAAVAAAATLPGLGSGTLWDNSETTYGEVAREILLTHNWVVMHQNGAPWFVQPPLYFWIGALCIKLFGVGSFALRLPSALATILAGALTAYAVARDAGLRTGIFAGVVLSTCLMQAVVGRLAIMDALLDTAVAWSIFAWYRSLQDGAAAPFVWGCVAAGLGFLAKGPVAPVIALLVIIPYAIWQARAGLLRLPAPLALAGGVAAFAVIALPWFAALAAASGAHSIVTLIGYYTVGRYTGTIENQSGPVWYYIPALILGFFPWIAFLPSAVAYGVTQTKQPLIRLAFAWAVLPLLFFSFAKTKLPNYIALEMPALAMLVAFYFEEALARARSRSIAVSTAAVTVAIALLAIGIALFSRKNRLTGDLHALTVDLAYLGAAILLGSVVAFVMLYRPRARQNAPHAIGAAMLAAMSVLALVMLPQAERLKPIPHLAPIVNAQERPGDAVAIMNVAGGNALMFYTHPGIHILRTERDLQQTLCAYPRTLLIAAKTMKLPPGASARPIGSSLNDNLYAISRYCAS